MPTATLPIRQIATVLVSAMLPLAVLGQTADDLRNDATTPGDVLTYGMGYNQQRFSPLKQINRQTVKRLVPAWSYSMTNNLGEEGQALIKHCISLNMDQSQRGGRQ